ncbi:hypothetical protein FGG08_001826 [Glutinoglossum americanum]|uniref:CAP-Gly domain-containing protein n=1 Tax=Glutinoglossum americanum TaxID=1670608 RepID=A0A9P8L611_9PEZI|nr:hypothetical protein FGG08_001826 [Glutinoglossum americanum]
MADFLSLFQVGQTVELNDGRIATIRYLGQPHFAEGDWIGVELESLTGKNDGSVQGERYFDCEHGRGMFVRPTVVRALEQQAQNGKANGAAQVELSKRLSRVQGGTGLGRRESLVDMAGKRQNMNAASPTPGPRAVAGSRLLRSPTKSPTKQLGSAAAPGASTPRTTTPSMARAPPSTAAKPRTSVTNRSSMGPPPPISATNRASRQSISGPLGGPARAGGVAAPIMARGAGSRLSLKPAQSTSTVGKRLSSLGEGSQGDSRHSSPDGRKPVKPRSPPTSRTPDTLARKMISPTLSRASAASGPMNPPGSSSSSSRGIISPPITQRPGGSGTVASREVEDLKTKLRVMEKKRMEDRDKLKALERIQGERDKYEVIIQKLQTKYQPQQQEIADLRKQIKEAGAKIEEFETQQAEHEIIVEMATLDREMAEENAEVLKTELEALKQKAEELELECEVLREENDELGQGMSPEEKTSQGWLQMERQNERLREALMRLRDMTQQQEGELKDHIKSLEEDLQELSGVKEQYETTKQKLAQSEANIEDLRQQLDTAESAEEMLEELTQRNLSMSEQIEELNATIEDLESLKELNDELELNHVETEKQMQEELDFKDLLIAEQTRKATQLEETMEDYEYTVSRFRGLVTNLQSDLEDMRASQQLTETEAEELTNRSRAMMDLNMKLQLSASKAQVKTIDLELRRLEAQEAAEHLAIVQLFLPEAFYSERDSILALLRFKRVGFKSNLLHGFVRERVNSQAPQGHEDDVLAACDVLDKLTWVTAMCDRFVSCISGCTVQQFAKFEGALYELEPVERALNGWIDGLRRDELKEKQCAAELHRTMALMSHLAEIHISENLEGYANDVQMRVLLMQSYLESTASAVSQTRAMVQTKLPVAGEYDGVSQYFARKTDGIISHSRSAKVVVGKVLRSLDDLKSRSLSLTPDTLPTFEQCENTTKEIAFYSRRLGEDLFKLLSEEGRTDQFTYDEVFKTMGNTAEGVLGAGESDAFAAFNAKLRSLTNILLELGSLASDLEMTVEFERSPAPWVARAHELKSTKVISVDVEEEIRRLKDDIHERATQIKLRDKAIEESAVKIELLESRMRDATKKGDCINELEKAIEQSRIREKDLAEAIDSQVREIQTLEGELDRWKKSVNDKQILGTVGSGDQEGAERAVATAREIDALRQEIDSLQGAVRYLRQENRHLRFTEGKITQSWLFEPLTPPKTQKQEQEQLVAAEGHDLLAELLNLTSTAKIYDLNKLPKNRLAWRPAKSTPRFHVLKQTEDYEAWASWRDSVTKRGSALREIRDPILPPKGTKPVVAKVDVRLPSLCRPSSYFPSGGLKSGYPTEIRIVNPGDFEAFRESMGGFA